MKTDKKTKMSSIKREQVNDLQSKSLLPID